MSCDIKKSIYHHKSKLRKNNWYLGTKLRQMLVEAGLQRGLHLAEHGAHARLHRGNEGVAEAQPEAGLYLGCQALREVGHAQGEGT